MADFLGAMSGHVGSQFSSSAPDLLDKTRLPGQIFRIQKKQQELLDKADSWAQYLARQPKPGANLPTEVLENLRGFYRREKQAAALAETSLHSLREEQRNIHQDDDFKSQASRSSSVVSKNAPEEGEDAGTPMTWSPSPGPDDNFTREEPNSPAPSSPISQVHHDDHDGGEGEQQAFMSQIPAYSPLLQPTVNEAKTQQSARPVFNDFPSSSLGADEELEVVAPNALVEEQPAPKKSSQLNPTPPSAQVQVPCTFDANSFVTERPCKDLASIQTVQERLARKNQAAPARPISLPQIVNQAADVPDSQSSMDSNSSVIPATNFAQQQRSPVRSLRMQPIKSTIKETPRLHPRPILQPTIEESSPPPPSPPPPPPLPENIAPAQGSSNDNTAMPEVGPGSPRMVLSSPGGPPKSAMPFVSQEAISSETSWSPFVDYCVAYPSYTGSLTDFVSACLCIPKRRLATYQYDDFIRAWKEGYLSYVQESEEGALVAIDWYLDIAEDLPLAYQAKIVTKDNLKRVLEAYPEEVALMKPQEMVQVFDSQGSQPPRIVAEKAQDVVKEAPVTRMVDVEPEIDSPSRRSSSSSVGFEDPPLPLKPLASLVERAPSERSEASITRSRPAIINTKSPQKRRPDDGAFHPPPKRTSHGSATPSEASVRSGPIVSKSTNYIADIRPPMSTGLSSKSTASNGRKKVPTVLDFQKFLKTDKVRKRHLDNISIASSAPPGTAPAHGRRGGPSR
ncbi:hypothetical protein G7054_g3511 [Neopestalotiopsis clavispora]|nr:hypothetical protein G7054_g3511 [Neopestalotiopsis clavispora]